MKGVTQIARVRCVHTKHGVLDIVHRLQAKHAMADQQRAVAAVVCFIVWLVAAFVETEDPERVLLESL